MGCTDEQDDPEEHECCDCAPELLSALQETRATLALVQATLDATRRERDAAESDLASLKAENERLKDDLAIMERLRQHGCECSDDEACLFARERDAARAEVTRLKSFSMALGSIANGMSRRHPSDPSKHELLALFEAELDAALADNIRSPPAESGTKEVALGHDKTEGT